MFLNTQNHYLKQRQTWEIATLNVSRQKRPKKLKRRGPCLLGPPIDTPSFVLLGDSHAGTIVSTLDAVAKEEGVAGAAFLAPGCLPILSVYRPDKAQTCTEVLTQAMKYIDVNQISTVLLVSSWNHYTGGTPGVFIVDATSTETSVSESHRVFEEGLTRMLNMFSEKHIRTFIMKEIPVQNAYNQRKIFRESLQRGMLVTVEETSLAEHRAYNEYTDSVFETIRTRGGVTLLDPATVFCSDGVTCALYDKDGSLLYSNNDHLNLLGANALEALFKQFARAAK